MTARQHCPGVLSRVARRGRIAAIVAGLTIAMVGAAAPTAFAADAGSIGHVMARPRPPIDGDPGGGDGGAPAPAPAPPSSPAAPPVTVAPAAHLQAMESALRYAGRSVTSILTMPAGLAGANPVSIHMQAADGPQFGAADYNPATGNTFRYNWPAGDGSDFYGIINVTLAEHTPSGAVLRQFYLHPIISPRYNVVRSDLQVRLINNCDFDLAGTIPVASEVEMGWNDSGTWVKAQRDMRAGDVATFHQFSKVSNDVSIANHLLMPAVYFDELDPPVPPIGFHSQPLGPTEPVLPGESRNIRFTTHSFDDEFCNAEVSYVVGVTLLTYTAL
ncbi:hypothetical protein [Pseudonocardia sp. GCM10023141]|uniref:hypothetical protein n=1 Tax=Pseudonocardia sp. GCM10023141 TaxID=3252653 RepID=UPI003612F629